MMDSSVALLPLPGATGCYERMEEDLTCPVCLELYADPLMMTCSHSICKTCLNDIKTMREKQGKTEFDCPTCRESHPIIPDLLDKLPKNLALENIVFRFQEIKSTSLSQSENLFDQSFASSESNRKETNIKEDNDDVFDEALMDNTCGMCDDNQSKKAEWFCPQCDVLYCQGCLNTFHPRKGSLGRHRVCKPMQRKVVKEKAIYCSEHTSERASIFCDTCKAVACHLCVCQGQGSHGNHVILDLNTARGKIQATFAKATEDLTVLISAFGLREKEMASQLDTIKSLHDTAQTQIASQFQCFMSDTAATLFLARQKFQETMAASTSQHSRPVETRSKQIKAALNRCLVLLEKCNGLISHSLEGNGNKGLVKSFQMSNQDEYRHFRARSLPQPFPSQMSSGNLSLSSSEDSPNSSLLDYRRGPRTKPRSRRSLSLLDQKEATQLPSQEFVNKLPPPVKSQEDLNSDSKDISSSSTKKKGVLMEDPTRVLMTSTPVPQSERKTNKSPVSLKNAADGGNFTSPKDKETSASGNVDKVERRSYHRGETCKQESVRNGSDRKLAESDKTYPEGVVQKHLLEDGIGRQSVKGRADSRAPCSSGTDVSMECQELRQDHSMLMQASQIEHMLEEITHLSKELDLMVLGNEEDLLSDVTRSLSSSLSSFNYMGVQLLSHLATDTDSSDVSEIPIMMPTVRSVASPVSPGQKGAPRVQSRTLITWGFNSTSFTAEPVESRGQWTVNITRNTSHIGDLKTGYLFGVGVARQSLASKEQVGMNPYSYGLICSNGTLAFCYDSHVTPITLLSDLPLTIRLAVSSSGHLGIVLSYWITLPGSMGTIQGRRVIALHGRLSVLHHQTSSGDDDGDCSSPAASNNSSNASAGSIDADVESSRSSLLKDGSFSASTPPSPQTPHPMLPVFTVSQRVKMTFPVGSDDS